MAMVDAVLTRETARLSVFEPEHLSRGMLDKAEFKVMVSSAAPRHRLFLRSTAGDLGGELYRRHHDHRLRDGRNSTKHPFTFKGSAAWGTPDGLSYRLEGTPGDSLWRFGLTVKLNGISLTKAALIAGGQYAPEPEPLPEGERNFINHTRSSLDLEEIVDLNYRLVVEQIQRAAAEFLDYLMVVRGGEAWELPDLTVMVKSVEVAVDRLVRGVEVGMWADYGGRVVRRLEPAWRAYTQGRIQSAFGNDLLIRSRRDRSLKVYEKGVDGEVVRAEVRLKGDGTKRLRFAPESLTPDGLRAQIIEAVKPYYTEIVNVSRHSIELPEADLLSGFVQIAAALEGKRFDAPSLEKVLGRLLRGGEVKGMTDGETKIIKHLRDADAAWWDPTAGGSTKPTERLVPWIRSVLDAEEYLRWHRDEGVPEPPPSPRPRQRKRR